MTVRYFSGLLTLLSTVALLAPACRADEDPDPAVLTLNETITIELQRTLDALAPIDDADPRAVDAYSRRGDLVMFLGRFEDAVSDYRSMVRLKPELDASHWRLGIVLYFAGTPDEAAAQFDRYHSFDDVDRENGIWRYLSHTAAVGAEKAAAQLLRYEKDDRPPFAEVYRMFDGQMTATQVRDAIRDDLPPSQRASRSFYSELYIGMHAVALNHPDLARPALRAAVLNEWPRTAGYGPTYMWHVARLQYMRLQPAPSVDAP